MNWMAMSPLQAAALWLAAGAVALWLYLHTRKPQHRRVSTLRFWASVQPAVQPRRRHLQEPWALLAQLLFLLFVIFALANPRWGSSSQGRDVAMVLDTSIYSQVRVAGQPSWIDQERKEAQGILDRLPAQDRVLLISTEPDAPPLLPFTNDRAALRKAIAAVQPSNSVADVTRSLETGKAALSATGRGLLVYVGPGMLDERQSQTLDEFRQETEKDANSGDEPQFLARLVGGDTPVANHGITRLSLRRDPGEPNLWHLLTQLKNYDSAKTTVELKLTVNGQSIGEQEIPLAPNELANAENQFVWDQGGVVQAEIGPADALDADNRASISLPSLRPVRVALIAKDSPLSNDLFTAVASNPYLQAELVRPGASPQNAPEVAIYESANPPAHLDFNSIWFLKGKGPAGAHPQRIAQWNAQHPVTRWVRSRDVSVRNPATLQLLPGDTVLATLDGNPGAPVMVAREQDGHRLVLIGFDPDGSNFAQQSAFPLVIAGSIEWMTHPVEEASESFSIGDLSVPGTADRIIAPSGKNVAFTSDGQNLHLLATEAGAYRLIAKNGESDIAVNIPLLPSQRMQARPSEMASIEPERLPAKAWDFWRWLAVLAAIALWLEWWLYYSSRQKKQLAEITKRAGNKAPASVQEISGRIREPSEDRAPKFVA